jgi:segregation and condensation protein B
MNSDLIKKIIEGALLAAGKPLDLARLESLFEDEECPPRDQIKAALEEIESDCRNRGFQLKEIASGYRLQVNQELSTWVNRLWDEKPKRYSRAMLETLSLIAYRQPLTRGDIELVRGVAVSSDIIRTLQERDWVRVVGHRDVPGRPALYATTKQFLDYFNLKSLEHLPALSEIKDFAELDPELELALGVGASLSLGAQADASLGAQTGASLGAPAANDEVVANENDVLDEDPTFALDQQLDGVVPADPEEEPQPSSAQDHE